MMKKAFTVLAAAFCFFCAFAQSNPQLYNLSLDNWSKDKKTWNPYSAGKAFPGRTWDTANKALSILGLNGVTPEEEHVAVKGEGKKAAKIESRNCLWAFVSGALYAGNFRKIVRFAGAEMDWGVPFEGRPKSFSGYYHYIPGIVNFAKKPYTYLKGKSDIGHITVTLTDWPEQYVIDSTKGNWVDLENDPHIIAHGEILIRHSTSDYVRFRIPLEYRNERTPKWVVIVCTPSAYGDFFTGADGSVLYVDELRFNY
ncbi:MAG: PCMD domain-containing protein [Bacteroidales bacterium]|nr:PCMD domain-containing protein [Bacteroidales bacterium]